MKNLLLVLAAGLTMLFTVTHPMGQTNIALGKVATQSGDAFPNGLASSAVDGNTDGNFANGSVTHTVKRLGPWWQLNLGADHQITEIRIWNRTDCCAERLNNLDVLIFDAKNHHQYSKRFASAAATNPLIIPVNVIGEEVLLVINKDEAEYLSLAEVEVFGSPLGQPAPVPTPVPRPVPVPTRGGYSIHTDATSVGEWEKFSFSIIWDGAGSEQFGMFTTYITTGKKGSFLWAVNGGGMGCNSGASPIRIDFASTQDAEEKETKGFTVFRINTLGDGYYSIQTVDESYLTAFNGGGKGASSLCNPIYTERIVYPSQPRPEHKFKIVDIGDGKKAIQTVNGYYLTAVDGGGRN